MKVARLLAILGFSTLMTMGVANAATLSFVMPQGVDPLTQLFFSFDGDTKTITGDDLMPDNGVEFHSALGEKAQFTSLKFSLNPGSPGFEGFFDIFLTLDPNCNVELPWTGPSQSGLPFTLEWQEGAAKIGQPIDCSQIGAVGPAFGLMFLSDTSGLPSNFGQVLIDVTPNGSGINGVPEPQAIAMFGGLLTAGIPWVIWRRRRA